MGVTNNVDIKHANSKRREIQIFLVIIENFQKKIFDIFLNDTQNEAVLTSTHNLY